MIQIQSLPSEEVVQGFSLVLSGSTATDLGKSNISLQTSDEDEEIPKTNVIAQVDIPPTLLTAIPSLPLDILDDTGQENKSESFRVAFNVYSSSALFVSPSLREINVVQVEFNRTVNTPVISLSIGNEKIANLNDPINFTFITLTVSLNFLPSFLYNSLTFK